MHRWGWRFCRKVITDAYILLTSFFVCVLSFHFRKNVLISFGTLLNNKTKVNFSNNFEMLSPLQAYSFVAYLVGNVKDILYV